MTPQPTSPSRTRLSAVATIVSAAARGDQPGTCGQMLVTFHAEPGTSADERPQLLAHVADLG